MFYQSYAEPMQATCLACSQTFTADVWVIVDIAERRDLRKRILYGSIHTLDCPHCEQPVKVDAPLLVYRPGVEPLVLFSPPNRYTPEQGQEEALRLIGLLPGRIGREAWEEAELYVDWTLSGVPREELPLALSNSKKVREHCEAQMVKSVLEEIRESDSESYLNN